MPEKPAPSILPPIRNSGRKVVPVLCLSNGTTRAPVRKVDGIRRGVLWRILTRMPLVSAWGVGLFATSALEPAIIHVPADHPTIQAGIDVAVNGDTVLVAPGTYRENINFTGKAITVKSEQGPEVTIIDGNHAGTVVAFFSGEGTASVLSGFTLQNGRSTSSEGGGIAIGQSSPSIMGNIITGNQACAGAGITISAGSPIVRNNIIAGNAQFGCSGGIGGGGISISGEGAAQILNNVISNNFMGLVGGGGISLFVAGTPTIKDNVISGNTALREGGGIWIVNHSDALIIQNLITDNHSSRGGGIFWLVPSGRRGPLLVSNTIADNDSPEGSGIFADGYDAQTRLVNNIIVARVGQTAVFCGDFNDLNPPILNFNDVFSFSGTAYGGICADQTGQNGNISIDPLFINPLIGDYHLQRGSAAIDAGDNTAPNLPAADFDGDPRILDGDGNGQAVIDMGIDELFGCAATGRSLLSGSVVRDIRGMRLTGTGIPGVTLTLTGPGGCANTATTRVLGLYEFAMLSNGTYVVTPSKAGCSFTPSSQTVTIAGGNTRADFVGTCLRR